MAILVSEEKLRKLADWLVNTSYYRLYCGDDYNDKIDDFIEKCKRID